ncbi:nuclear transport factor 2 family protein [Catalinimonas niigatensis]|uniref:hypothetical protein n=1 Tax=Catalinimonas niigatensis TaxID=1397264 RepID=UPI002665FBE3|nr:hypothetical protein [Catalinimonas niigatensis]WPP49339.1 hypothetical protein PZB72_21965 [Catalinimonas niigatensis]
MSIKEIIETYLRGLEEFDVSAISTLFSKSAVVHSPWYGKMAARVILQETFFRYQKSVITLLHIFQEVDKRHMAAAHFRYDWRVRDSSMQSFECVDVFYFDAHYNIREMHISYNT